VCLLQNAQLASSLINIFTDVKDVNLKDAQNVHKQVDALSVQTPSLSLQTRHANTNVTELDNSTIQ
jgi:peroxiredoxin